MNQGVCDSLETCSFFNDLMKNLPSTADLMKARFCHGDFSKCARLRVKAALGPDAVPRDLAPNDDARVDRILAG